MWLFWLVAALIPVAAAVLYSVFGSVTSDLSSYGSPEWLTLMGTGLSYVGLVTSTYAVIRIAELSKRGFARVRLPELQSSLIVICDQMATFAGDASDLRSERFLAGIPALARSLKRIADIDIARLANTAISSQDKLVKWAGNSKNQTQPISGEKTYWDLMRVLNELSVEISERIKEEKAR